MSDPIPTPADLAARQIARDTKSRQRQEANRARHLEERQKTERLQNPGGFLTAEYAGQTVKSIEVPNSDEYGSFDTLVINFTDGRQLRVQAIACGYEGPALELNDPHAGDATTPAD